MDIKGEKFFLLRTSHSSGSVIFTKNGKILKAPYPIKWLLGSHINGLKTIACKKNWELYEAIRVV